MLILLTAISHDTHIENDQRHFHCPVTSGLWVLITYGKKLGFRHFMRNLCYLNDYDDKFLCKTVGQERELLHIGKRTLTHPYILCTLSLDELGSQLLD